VVSAAGVTVDVTRRTASVDGQTLDLTTTEFDLLRLLVERPGQVFTRLQLLDGVQGNAYEGYERTIDVHVKNLRKKLSDNPQNPRYIETIRGAGYRFCQEQG
jgi:DNA-binding response OmpR family regulator